jgi:hypothetical protein
MLNVDAAHHFVFGCVAPSLRRPAWCGTSWLL